MGCFDVPPNCTWLHRRPRRWTMKKEGEGRREEKEEGKGDLIVPDQLRENVSEQPETWPTIEPLQNPPTHRRTLSRKSAFIPRTCSLWNVLLSSSFLQSCNLSSLKSEINELNLFCLSSSPFSRFLCWCFLTCHHGHSPTYETKEKVEFWGPVSLSTSGLLVRMLEVCGFT